MTTHLAIKLASKYRFTKPIKLQIEIEKYFDIFYFIYLTSIDIFSVKETQKKITSKSFQDASDLFELLKS